MSERSWDTLGSMNEPEDFDQDEWDEPERDEPSVDVLELHLSNMQVHDDGSIVLLTPLSQAAMEWLQDNVDPDAQWYFDSLVVERRYLDGLLQGLEEAGLY